MSKSKPLSKKLCTRPWLWFDPPQTWLTGTSCSAMAPVGSEFWWQILVVFLHSAPHALFAYSFGTIKSSHRNLRHSIKIYPASAVTGLPLCIQHVELISCPSYISILLSTPNAAHRDLCRRNADSEEWIKPMEPVCIPSFRIIAMKICKASQCGSIGNKSASACRQECNIEGTRVIGNFFPVILLDLALHRSRSRVALRMTHLPHWKTRLIPGLGKHINKQMAYRHKSLAA